MRFYWKTSRRGLVCVVLLVCVAALGSLLLSDPAAARKTPLEWGLYQILWSRAYGRQLEEELKNFASRPAYVMFYRDLGRPYPRFAIDAIADRGGVAVVSLELWQWHGGRKGSYLPAIVAGEFDDFLRRWAGAAKTDGRRVILRFGFEFNGDWFTWSRDPDTFVTAWRHAHDIFREVGAVNVEWLWTPNVVSCPDTPENDLHRYYPGDSHVDWIGVDGYNFGDHHDQLHRWQSFEEVFGAVLDGFRKRYRNKPVMLAEFACAPSEPKRRAEWIRNAYASLQGRPQVRAVIWFNFDKRREGEPNWRIDSTSGSGAAFNETFAAPPAAGARRREDR